MSAADRLFNQETPGMTLPTNGITPEVIRAAMPPYQLSTDLLAAMLAAVPAPPSDATTAWRQERAARLVHEVAGLMPADAPQARIAAEIVIAREAADASFARANTPGLAVEQVCRLRRIASTLMNSAAVLERSLMRHQQKPAPFCGTVLADGIDVAALAAGWGGPGSRPDGGGGGGASAEGTAAGGRGDRPGAMAGACGDSPDTGEGGSGGCPAVTVGRRAPAGPGRDAGS